MNLKMMKRSNWKTTKMMMMTKENNEQTQKEPCRLLIRPLP